MTDKHKAEVELQLKFLCPACGKHNNAEDSLVCGDRVNGFPATSDQIECMYCKAEVLVYRFI